MEDSNSKICTDLLSVIEKIRKDHPERTENKGEVYLDSHENPHHAPYNRYFDNTERMLIQTVGKIFQQPAENIIVDRGVEGLFDLLLRMVCVPHRDNIAVVSPLDEKVVNVARLNRIDVRRVMTNEQFVLEPSSVAEVVSKTTQIIYLDQPGVPTGRLHPLETLKQVLNSFEGLVVVNETFLPFSQQPSLRTILREHSNLIVLQSLGGFWASDAFGLAVAFMNAQLANDLRTVQRLYPQPLPCLTLAEEFLSKQSFDTTKWRTNITEERAKVMSALKPLPFVVEIYPSAANYFMVKFNDAAKTHQYLLEQGIHTELVQSHHPSCENCICFTIGLSHENTRLISALRNFNP